MKKARQGLLMVILSGVVYGLMPGAVTYCYRQGANATLMVVARYAVVALIMLPWALKGKNSFALFRENWKGILRLSLVSAATPTLLYTAYSFLATGVVTSLHFLYPALVVLLCAVFYGDRPSRYRLLCVGLCMVGTLLVLGTGMKGNGWSARGVILSLCSALTWALYIVWLDKVKLGSMSLPQLLFFVDGCSSLMLGLIYGPLSGTLPLRISIWGWGVVVGISAFIGIFGTAFFTFGVRHSDAQAAAIASTLEPITSMAVGILLLGEPFVWRSLLGSAFILGAVILLAIHPKQNEEKGVFSSCNSDAEEN